jgi:Tfp pilus assembly protein PilX
MTTNRRIRRLNRQKGGVTLLLIMVLIVLAALVGVLAVRGATSDLQMAGSQRVARTEFYCAEAGLNYARTLAANNPKDWAAILANGPFPTWYPSVAGIALDVDGDTVNDVTVVMRDNVDETGAQDFTKDQDLTVILTATCTSSTIPTNSATRAISQLVTYSGAPGPDYCFQAGHSSTHSGNANCP